MRFARLLLAVLLIGAGAAFADDTTTIVLGTGSRTGTVTAASPAASGVGDWIQVTGAKESEDFLTFQISGMGTNVVRIEVSLDGVAPDVPYTFTADNQIYKIEACGACVYRAICGTFTSGSPIVKATVSGKASLKVIVP